MDDKVILLIERAGNKDQTFRSGLERKDYKLKVVRTGKAAFEALETGKYVLVILNAASLGTTGLRICKKIKDTYPSLPVIHIFTAETKDADVKRSEANVKLALPFTSRKLINRIKRLMPVEESDLIKVGPITYSPVTRMVHAYGREKKLTPKAGNLLEEFLNNPGKTLERSTLMKKVWKTDYIGDTRTLDVHIRWVREAIEKNTKKPRHLVTIRGVGYQFIVKPAKIKADKSAPETKKTTTKKKTSTTEKK